MKRHTSDRSVLTSRSFSQTAHVTDRKDTAELSVVRPCISWYNNMYNIDDLYPLLKLNLGVPIELVRLELNSNFVRSLAVFRYKVTDSIRRFAVKIETVSNSAY